MTSEKNELISLVMISLKYSAIILHNTCILDQQLINYIFPEIPDFSALLCKECTNPLKKFFLDIVWN